MNKWNVTVFRVGRISAERSGVTHNNGVGEKVVLPVWCAALTDGEHKVLVDTGIADIDWVINGPEPNFLQSPEEETMAAFTTATGWSPEDVDILINTHLHFDHCGRNDHFPNARIYVQKKEIEAAYNPIPSEAHLYQKKYFDKKAIPYFRWYKVEGEIEIAPGLMLFPTPGHSRGHQSVLVYTDEGSLCIAGDIVSVVENINENIETNIITNTEEIFKSFEKIRRLADRIIPGHEPGIENYSTKGFPIVMDFGFNG